jgi:hypothetical protein
MNRAHSSAGLVCDPLGEIGIVLVAPEMFSPLAAWLRNVVPIAMSELLSCAAPLLMKMM